MQEYRSGDEVFLIHSRQYAWIVERRDDDSWVVDLDGDYIPVHEEDLVPASQADQFEPPEPDAAPAAATSKDAPEPALAPDAINSFAQVFVPLGQGRYQRWLVNGTVHTLRVQVSQAGKSLTESQLSPGAKLDLGALHRDDLHEQQALTLTCRYTVGLHKLERSFQKDLRIRMAAFAKREAAAASNKASNAAAASNKASNAAAASNKASNAAAASDKASNAGNAASNEQGPALIFNLFQDLPGASADFSTYSPPNLNIQIQRSVRAPYMTGLGQGQTGNWAQGRAGREALPPELDLHIEKLVEHPEKLHPAEMLAVQLARAAHYLDRASLIGLNKVYLIHGLGTGRLREELHDLLRRHPRVRSFQNSHFPRYGFGATEVLLDV